MAEMNEDDIIARAMSALREVAEKSVYETTEEELDWAMEIAEVLLQATRRCEKGRTSSRAPNPSNPCSACGQPRAAWSEVQRLTALGATLRRENEDMRRLLGKLLPGDEDKNRDALLEERRNLLAAK